MELEREIALLTEKVALMERLVELERQLQAPQRPTYVPYPLPAPEPYYPMWPVITWSDTTAKPVTTASAPPLWAGYPVYTWVAPQDVVGVTTGG